MSHWWSNMKVIGLLNRKDQSTYFGYFSFYPRIKKEKKFTNSSVGWFYYQHLTASDINATQPGWYGGYGSWYIIQSQSLALDKIIALRILCMRQIQHFWIFWSITLLLYHLFKIGQALFWTMVSNCSWITGQNVQKLQILLFFCLIHSRYP